MGGQLEKPRKLRIRYNLKSCDNLLVLLHLEPFGKIVRNLQRPWFFNLAYELEENIDPKGSENSKSFNNP